jgi:hypothetical protein
MVALIYESCKLKDAANIAFDTNLRKTQIVKVTQSIGAYNRGARLGWRSCLLRYYAQKRHRWCRKFGHVGQLYT